MNMTGNAPKNMRGRGRNKSRIVKVVPIQKQVMGPPTLPVLKRKQIFGSGTSSSHINWNGNQRSFSATNLSDSMRTTTTTRSYSTSELESRVILALTEGRGEAIGEVGIAAINITRPSLILCQISDSQSYINTLTKINILNPTEILVPLTFVESVSCNRLMEKLKEQFRNITITGISRSSFNNRVGMEYVKQLCVPSMNSIFLILQHRYYALSAAAALLRYTETTFFIFYAKESIKVVYQESEESTIIDVATADRLELVASARPTMKKRYSCLLDVLNHCHTKIGTRTLRANILQPPCSLSEIEGRLNCITELMESSEMLTAIREILLKATNIDQLLTLATILPDHAQSCSERQLNYLLTLNTVLQQIEPLKHILQCSQQPFFVELFKLLNNVEFLEVKSLVQNIIHDDAHSAKGQNGIIQRCFAIKSGLNTVLDLVRKSYSERLDEMREYVKGLSEKYGLSLVLHNNNKKGYHILLNLNGHQKRIFKRNDIPAEFIQVEHLTSSYTMKTPQLINLSHRVEDIMTEILTMSNIMIHKLLIKIRNHVAIFYNLCEAVAKLDMLQSLANASNNINYVRPNFADYLEVINARHPLLNFLCSQEPVANSTYASADYNMHIITGPNGSGKSIFIRQIVLIQVMAQVGCYIPAESATLKLCDRILARVYLEDNIHCDASAFVLELKEINYFLNVLTSKTLIIIDELCRSTSVEEGTALAMAICERLLKTDAIMFFTTHYKFLTRLEDLYFNVKTWQLETLTETKNNEMVLHFTYNVIPGVVLLEHYGVFLAKATWPETIMKYVYSVIEDLSKSQTTRSLHFKKVSEAARLKYDFEAEAKSLKAKGQLTRFKINEKLANYQKQLAEVGHHTNVSFVDLQESCSFRDNLIQTNPYAKRENNFLVEHEVNNFGADSANDSSFAINDQFGLVQIEVSAEVHNADNSSSLLYKMPHFDHVSNNIFQSAPKLQLDNISLDNISISNVNSQIINSDVFNESHFRAYEPQVILAESNDCYRLSSLRGSKVDDTFQFSPVSSQYSTKALVKNNSSNLFPSPSARQVEDLTFEISQPSSSHSMAFVNNDEVKNRPSFFHQSTFPLDQCWKTSEGVESLPTFENSNESSVNDQITRSSQDIYSSKDSLSLSKSEASMNPSSNNSLLLHDSSVQESAIENDLNCSCLSITESQFGVVLQQADFRTSTPVPELSREIDVKNASEGRPHFNSNSNGCESIQLLPLPRPLTSCISSDCIKWKESEDTSSSKLPKCGPTDSSLPKLFSKQFTGCTNSDGIKWQESDDISLSKLPKSCPADSPRLSLPSSTEKSGNIMRKSDVYQNSDKKKSFKFKSLTQQNPNELSKLSSDGKRLNSTSDLNASIKKPSSQKVDDNKFESNSSTKIVWGKKEKSTDSLTDTSNKSCISQLGRGKTTIEQLNLDKMVEQPIVVGSSNLMGGAKKISNFTSSSCSNSDIKWTDNMSILASRSLIVCSLDKLQPFLKSNLINLTDSSDNSNKQNIAKEKSSEISDVLEDLANCSEYFSCNEWDGNEPISSRAQKTCGENVKAHDDVFETESCENVQTLSSSHTNRSQKVDTDEKSRTNIFGEDYFQSREIERSFMSLVEVMSDFEASCTKQKGACVPKRKESFTRSENGLLGSREFIQNRSFVDTNEVPPLESNENLESPILPISRPLQMSRYTSIGAETKGTAELENTSLEPLGDIHLELFSDNSICEELEISSDKEWENYVDNSSCNSDPNSKSKKRKRNDESTIKTKIVPNSTSKSSKKTKWLPPFKATSNLSKKEIERIYFEQNKRALKSGDMQLIVNRPSVRQLQQVEHIVSAHKTSSGVVVVPAPKKRVLTKKKFVTPLKQPSSDFDVRIFSDHNSRTYEQMNLSVNFSHSQNGSFITSSPVVSKAIQNSNLGTGHERYSQNKQEIDSIAYKYLNLDKSYDDAKLRDRNFDDSFNSSSSSLFKLN